MDAPMNGTASPDGTIDPEEVARFSALAEEWWDPNGKFKPLHMLNPCRLDYITSQIAAEFDRDLSAPEPFKGLRILDIGCGGGPGQFAVYRMVHYVAPTVFLPEERCILKQYLFIVKQ